VPDVWHLLLLEISVETLADIDEVVLAAVRYREHSKFVFHPPTHAKVSRLPRPNSATARPNGEAGERAALASQKKEI
jgi:hypothetical protein